MSREYPWKARKQEVLQFIKKRGFVSRYELEERFGLAPEGVNVRLRRLKKAGLVINMTKNCHDSHPLVAQIQKAAHFVFVTDAQK